MDIKKSISEINKKSNSNFLYSFSLLNKEKQDAIKTIYAFCRKADDITDDENLSDEIKIKNLSLWRKKLNDILIDNKGDEFFTRLKSVVDRFHIPKDTLYALIDGMEMDLTHRHYNTFDDLKIYCYNVASTVGLMSINIFGYKNSSAIEYAINLGIALQLTNILRDIRCDAESGRIYLPLDDMKKFGYSKDELLSGVYNEAFCSLMKYECEKAESFYRIADNHLAKEDRASMFSARIMEHIYHLLLKKIQIKNYDVFSNKIRISKFRKFYIAIGIYLKYNFLYGRD